MTNRVLTTNHNRSQSISHPHRQTMGAEDAPAYTRREASSSEHQADLPPAYEPGAGAQSPPPPPVDSKGGSTGGSFGSATPGSRSLPRQLHTGG